MVTNSTRFNEFCKSLILQKPAALTAEEWCIMRRHCQIGYDILSKSDAAIFKLAAEVALFHHEKWDGSGYPKGLVADEIPELVRIVSLADVFDALTMRRPYKAPWPLADAIKAVKEGAGCHFDPKVTECFFDIQPKIIDIQLEWEQLEAERQARPEKESFL